MRFTLVGQRNHTGIGNHFGNFADALKILSPIPVQEVDFTNNNQIIAASTSSTQQDINIGFIGSELGGFFKGKEIQWIVFESTRVPPHLLNCLRQADQIWVPSEWGRNTLLLNHFPSQQLRVIPEGVSAAFKNKSNLTHGTKFRFLSVGKFEQRKSTVEIVQAFVKVFANNNNVELVLKTNVTPEFTAQIKSYSNIHVIDGHVNIADLYEQSDAFVLPSKGEAWGLPLIEAAAMSLPIITTNYSGHTEFLQPISDSCIFVDFELKPITCSFYQHCYPVNDGFWGMWAWPSVDSIANAMQRMVDQYQFFKEKAQQNSIIIHEKFSWLQSASKALNTLGIPNK